MKKNSAICHFEKRNRIIRSAIPAFYAIIVVIRIILSQGIHAQITGKDQDQITYLETIADSMQLYAKYTIAISGYKKLAYITYRRTDKTHYILALNRLTDGYIETDSILNATRYCRMALDSAQKYLPENDPELAYAYKNMGEIFNRRGIGKKAFEYLFWAAEIMQQSKQDDHLYLAYIYSDIGYEYDVAWEFNQAIAYHLKALSIIRKLYPEDHPITASFVNKVGDCFYGNNDFKTAQIWHRKSLNTFMKWFGENHPATGENLMDIGKNFLFLRVKDSSAYYLEKALPVLLNFYSEHHRIVCHYYEVMGYFCFNSHTCPEYILNMEKSLALLKQRDVFHHRKIAWVSAWLGNMFRRDLVNVGHPNPSRLDSSFKYNCEAIEALVPGYSCKFHFDNPPLQNAIDNKSLLNVLRDKVSIHKNKIDNISSDPAEMLALINTTSLIMKLAGMILEERQSEESRAALLAEIFNYINTAIKTSFDYYTMTGERNFLDTAFYFSEMNKARLLASVMNRQTAMQLSEMPDSIVDQEKEINDKITTLDNTLLKIRPAALPEQKERTEQIQDELFEAKQEQFRFYNKVHSAYPGFYQTCFNKKPATIHGIRQALGSDEALVYYSVIGYEWSWPGRMTCFVITKDTLAAFSKTIDQKTDSIMRYLCSFVARSQKTTGKNEFAQAGAYVFDYLLGPVRELIKGKSLIIVPDDCLHRLPFEVLLTDSVSDLQTDFRELPYLIRDHAISYAHSASLFYDQRSKEKKSPKPVQLFALAPAFDQGKATGDPLLAEWIERGEDFSELKGAQEETGFIHQLCGGLLVAGKEATEETFKKNCPDYGILHVATHGVVDDRYPMLSKLVFYHDSTEKDDGFLNVYELYGVDLNAQLVVLSACNTGYGTFKKGEGVVSIARGFAYAGVPSVVMSLWKVSDRSTARLMKYFYTYLKAGYSKDKALQLAKLEFLGENDPFYSNPHFWAGFVQIGDTVPVEFENKTSNIIWVLLIVFVLSGSGFAYLKFKSSRKKRI